MLLRNHAPKTLEGRISLASDSNFVFDFPSDAETIDRVWDLGANAKAITSISNSGGLINVEYADHGLEDDNVVTIHSVVTATEAIGTWVVTYVDDDNFTLNNSTYASTDTTGYFFEESSDFTLIHRKPESEISLTNELFWFLRNQQIIVDDKDFENDILVKYVKVTSAITDIPAKYHLALVAFNVIHLIRLPKTDDPSYPDYKESLMWQKSIWETFVEHIKGGARQSTESLNLNRMTRIKNLRI